MRELEKKRDQRKMLAVSTSQLYRSKELQKRRNSKPVLMSINTVYKKAPRVKPKTDLKKQSISKKPVGIQKRKLATIKNDLGRKYVLKTKEITRAKSCSSVFVGRQDGAICWFAAIFTSFFSSQFMRVVMRNHSYNLVNDPASKELAKAVLSILKGYSSGKVSPTVANYLQPRQFLTSMRKYRPDYFSSMTNGTDEAHYAPYQHALLAFLKVPHLSLGFVRGHFVYSGFNADLPLDSREWKRAIERLPLKGVYVNTDKPEVIIIHRDFGEDYIQTLVHSPTPQIKKIEGFNPNEHMPVIKYNGARYLLDSCVIGSELRSASCSVAHAIAGVTCNNERYVYNGWTASTKDPAMKGASINNSVIKDRPCALYKYPWDKNRNFVINLGACRFDNARPDQRGKELVFNAVARSSVIYVRADIIKRATIKIAKRI